MERRYVELFDFVVDDHHESSDLALDYGEGGVVHSPSSPRAERMFVTRLDQLLGDEPEVAIAPSEMPDLSDRRRVLRCTGGLTTLCVEVDVNDRGAFLFAEHDERDSLSRPYGEGYGLVEEVAVVRDFLLHVVRERFYRHFFTSNRPRDAQVALRKGHPH
jgi:hypothetical protein